MLVFCPSVNFVLFLIGSVLGSQTRLKIVSFSEIMSFIGDQFQIIGLKTMFQTFPGLVSIPNCKFLSISELISESVGGSLLSLGMTCFLGTT